jgi:hypothetical protein
MKRKASYVLESDLKVMKWYMVICIQNCPWCDVTIEWRNLFIGKKDARDWKRVFVACKIKELLKQLIVMSNGLYRKFRDDVIVSVLPAMVVLG